MRNNCLTLALSILLFSVSALSMESPKLDCFMFTKLAHEMADKIKQAENENKIPKLNGIVALMPKGFEVARHLAERLDIRIFELMALGDIDNFELPSDTENLKKSGEGYIFVISITRTGYMYYNIKKRFPKAVFASFYKEPTGKADFFVKEIPSEQQVFFHWDTSIKSPLQVYKDGVITPEMMKSYALILKEKLVKGGIDIPNIKGFLISTRGGLIPALYLGELLGVKNYETFCTRSYKGQTQTELEVLKEVDLPNDGEGWLVIEDMIDTGKTAELLHKKYPRINFVTIHIKQLGKELLYSLSDNEKKFRVFYAEEANKWIRYYWEDDAPIEQ